MLGQFMDRQVLRVQYFYAAAFVFLLGCIISDDAHAAAATPDTISTIADNIATNAGDLPGLVSAFAYLLGLLFGIRGIMKLKAHVENPGEAGGQTPLRTPIIAFVAGGAFFALPTIYRAATWLMNGGVAGGSPFATASSAAKLGTLFGGTNAAPDGNDFSEILNNIAVSITSLPGLVTAIAYLLGLLIIFMGIIKVKEHVESPEQVKIQEGVIRLVTGGALLAMPTIFSAMFNSFDASSGGSILSGLNSIFSGAGFFNSEYIAANCTAGSASMGQLICDIVTHTGAFPAFLTAIAYLFGLVMGVWGVLKIRDHVLNPQQTNVFEGISRLLAGGAFFALPVVIEVFKNTISDGAFGAAIAAADPYNYGQNDGVTTFSNIASGIIGGGTCPSGAGLGLDGMLVCFATDILGPVHVLLNFFAFVAGMIFIMVGISRLIKGAQEGTKAPGGLGTMMTFAIGGALIAYNDIIKAASTTFTGNATTATYASLDYTTGMTSQEAAAATAVVTSIIKFMIVIGIISFVRGLFIVRSVAEGNQQASMMAGVTHIIGGALAVNLGPVLNAVQSTLGTTGYGISFAVGGP